MKFESTKQKKPVFEAKGIETIRKDQCSLTQNVLRKALTLIFANQGSHGVKDFLCRQWALIHGGKLPISEYILTGRVRSHYRGGKIGPVQAALARRLAEVDPGRIIKHKERLPYVIVASPGRNFKLRDCVLTPMELLEQWDSFTLHATYYATNHVNAALQRCLGLPPLNINVTSWYEACPKPRKRIHFWPVTRTGGSTMISAYFGSDICALCQMKCKTSGSARVVICEKCKVDRVRASFLALKSLNYVQTSSNDYANICQRCNGCLENSGNFAVEKPIRQKKRDNEMSLGANKTFGSTVGIFTPLSNCTCIDCPITYKRHHFRESEAKALELCKSLDIL
mmetsp:Transcript_2917/g.4108  ORF Transcript_2917/g.4108 Transcript_2917/m.4108 type:complete len:339 (+) Transcript_2917:31-1047(+)